MALKVAGMTVGATIHMLVKRCVLMCGLGVLALVIRAWNTCAKHIFSSFILSNHVDITLSEPPASSSFGKMCYIMHMHEYTCRLPSCKK